MSSIVPDREQVQKLIETHQGKLVMLNLLKFKARADGEERTGAEAYNRYGQAVVPMITSRGGRVIFSGKPVAALIGDASDDWDEIAIIEYASAQAFLEMVTSAEYQAIHHHREAGLLRTKLIACSPVAFQAESNR